MNNYELAKIDYSNGMSTKEIAEKYSVSVATVRKWKSRHNWDSVTKKRDKNVTNKKAKEVAKILIEEGATIKEASDQTGLNYSTAKNYSAEENWVQNRKDFSQRVYSELQAKHLADHLQRKETALGYLDFITEMTIEKLKEDKISVDKAAVTIMTSIKGQNDILGVLSPKATIDAEISLARLELEKSKTVSDSEEDADDDGTLKIEVIKNG